MALCISYFNAYVFVVYLTNATSNAGVLTEDEVFYIFVVYITMWSGSQSSDKRWDA